MAVFSTVCVFAFHHQPHVTLPGLEDLQCGHLGMGGRVVVVELQWSFLSVWGRIRQCTACVVEEGTMERFSASHAIQRRAVVVAWKSRSSVEALGPLCGTNTGTECLGTQSLSVRYEETGLDEGFLNNCHLKHIVPPWHYGVYLKTGGKLSRCPWIPHSSFTYSSFLSSLWIVY